MESRRGLDGCSCNYSQPPIDQHDVPEVPVPNPNSHSPGENSTEVSEIFLFVCFFRVEIKIF